MSASDDKMFDEAVQKAVDDIKQKVIGISDEIGWSIVGAIQINWDKCITAFYKDYPKPKFYNRGYNTYEASNGENGVGGLYTITVTKTGIIIEGGITVDKERLGKPYDDDTDYVFNRTYNQGIHGTLAIKQMSPSPSTLMDKWFKEYSENGHKLEVNKVLRKVGLSLS